MASHLFSLVIARCLWLGLAVLLGISLVGLSLVRLLAVLLLFVGLGLVLLLLLLRLLDRILMLGIRHLKLLDGADKVPAQALSYVDGAPL